MIEEKCSHETRFKKMDEKDLLELASESIPTNTKRKAMWAFRLYESWQNWRKSNFADEQDEKSKVSKILEKTTELLDISRDEDLCEVLSQFITEVRKEGGERYPGKTLHEIVSSLQKYFEMKGKQVQLFAVGGQFDKLQKALDVEMKISTSNKLGLQRKQAQVISEEMENDLWGKKILGDSCPKVLLRTTLYLIGLNFGMRARDEHRNLSIRNFSFHCDSEGREYLLYSEGVSKTIQGGLKHRKLTPKVSRAYANVQCPEKCIVRIVKSYIERCPKEALDNAFYLKPLQNYEQKKFWYCSVPLGHNTLKNVVQSMMKEAGVDGFFTNHSLRATAATRLFQENVDDKLIRGVTGHRSESLQSYKRVSDKQLAKVSNIVQSGKEGICSSTETANIGKPPPEALGIPSNSGQICLNVSGGAICNITIHNN